MPPRLSFCVGVTVEPGCQFSTGSIVDLGELDAGSTRAGTSQFADSTNDENGYTVRALGNTLTSGNRVIDPLDATTESRSGEQQFGINLRQNTTPAVGSDVTGLGTGSPRGDYSFQNRFRFVSGEVIAGSNLPTDFNRYTVSYIANVELGQSAGVYASTIQYIATAQF